MEERFIEIFKSVLATRYPEMAFFFDGQDSFISEKEKEIVSSQALIINGMKVRPPAKRAIYSFKFRVVGDIDECWMRSDYADGSSSTAPACTVSYLLIEDMGADGRKELMNFGEVLTDPGYALDVIDQVYEQIFK